MQQFRLAEFLARSTDMPFDETGLAKALTGLPKLSATGPWLAGGSLRRTLGGQPPDSDFDFFFRDELQLESFRRDLERRSFTISRETDHHVELRGVAAEKPAQVQLIRFAFYASAEAVINSFDFTICQFAFDGDMLTCGDFALWDLGRKRLATHRITFPLSTMRRVLKYAKQGFTACPGALTSILTSVADEPALRQQLSIEYVD